MITTPKLCYFAGTHFEAVKSRCFFSLRELSDLRLRMRCSYIETNLGFLLSKESLQQNLGSRCSSLTITRSCLMFCRVPYIEINLGFQPHEITSDKVAGKKQKHTCQKTLGHQDRLMSSPTTNPHNCISRFPT